MLIHRYSELREYGDQVDIDPGVKEPHGRCSGRSEAPPAKDQHFLSAVGFRAMQNAEDVKDAAFLLEAKAVIADAEAELVSRPLEPLNVAFLGIHEPV